MCKFGFNSSQLYFSLPRVGGKVNQSLKSGIFPTKLKIAKVTPIYKKGCKKLQINYKPISVLPTISKILERVISDQLTQYFYDQHLN